MSQHSEITNAPLSNCPIRTGRKEEIMFIPGNVADNFQVAAGMPPVIVLGASAARDILMPAATTGNHGLCFTFISSSTTTTGVLTFKDSADQALSPAVSIAQNLSVELIYIHGVGWRKKAQ